MLAKGIFIGVGDGGGPEVFNQILNVTSLSSAAITWSLEDVTSHNDTVPVKEQVPTLRNGGGFDLVIDFDESDDFHAQLRGLATSGDLNNFKITYPGGLIGSFEFAGYTTKFTIETPVNGIRKAKVTIEAFGTITDEAPKVVSLTVTDAHKPTYVTDDVMLIQAIFDEEVLVTGTPQVTIGLTSGTKHASYSGGSGTNKLTFAYTIVSGDSATATNVSLTSPLTLNSGTIKDTQAQAATLTFTPPTTSSYTVN